MQQMPITYDTGILAARVAGERGRVLANGLSVGVTVLVLAGVLAYVWLERQWEFSEVFAMATWLLAFSAAAGTVILVTRLVWFTRLRGGLRAVGEGVALVVSPWGIQSAEGAAPWPEITRIAAVKGRLGHGYGLVVERNQGAALMFPLEGLDILPGTLDSAVRAYSAGRHGVDLSVVDD